MLIINQETLLGRDAWVESDRVKEPRKTALHVFHSLRFYGDGASSKYNLNVAIFYHLHHCHLYPSQYYLPSGPQNHLLTDTSILYSQSILYTSELFVVFLAAFDPDNF